MSKVFSALSNPAGDLQSLQYEFTDLINFFNDRETKKKADFGCVLNAPLHEITSSLLKEQKDISLFHFSGHSGHSGLDLEGEDFESAHVADFFNALSAGEALQCVFLNGCDNESIVARLKNVPVIIGTRSEIQDHKAKKFTLDFFRALIGGENSYEEAFRLAMEAGNISDTEISITRGESGRSPLASTQPVVPYFLQINKGNTGKSRFAFKPKQVNWTKFLVIIFLAVALILGWFFRDQWMTRLKGYNCTPLTPQSELKPEQCVFAVGDINQPTSWISISQLVYDKVKINPLLNEYLYPINIGSFSTVVRDSGVDRDSLPSYCGYDFNLTGTIYEKENEGENHVVELAVFPFASDAPPSMPFKYEVKSLAAFGSLLSSVDSNSASSFVLFQMCYSCGMTKDNEGIVKAMAYLADRYDPSHSTETYQQLNYDLSSLQLQYRDTVGAIVSLDKIRMAVGNDFALAAIERKSELLMHRGDIKGAYEAQTALLYALSDRVEDSTQFKLSTQVRQYELASQKVRLARANMVLEHRDGKLKEYREEALQDFYQLQQLKTPPGDFTSEINLLKGQASVPEPATPPAPVKKSVTFQAVGMDPSMYQNLMGWFKSNGYSITGASENFKSAPASFAKTAEIIYHSQSTREAAYSFSGRLKARTKTNFQVNFVPISGAHPDPAGAHNLQVRWVSTKEDHDPVPEQAIIYIRGQLVNAQGLPVDSAIVSFADKKRYTDSKGTFDLGSFDLKSVYDTPIYIQCQGYEDKILPVHEFKTDQTIQLIPKGPPAKPVIMIRAYQVGRVSYDKLIDGLRSKGYQIDLKQSLYSDKAPEEKNPGSAIIYWDKAYAQDAYMLARQIKEWYRIDFEVRQEQSGFKSDMQSTLKKSIAIFWVIRID